MLKKYKLKVAIELASQIDNDLSSLCEILCNSPLGKGNCSMCTFKTTLKLSKKLIETLDIINKQL
jgi:hypothetical protein